MRTAIVLAGSGCLLLAAAVAGWAFWPAEAPPRATIALENPTDQGPAPEEAAVQPLPSSPDGSETGPTAPAAADAARPTAQPPGHRPSDAPAATEAPPDLAPDPASPGDRLADIGPGDVPPDRQPPDAASSADRPSDTRAAPSRAAEPGSGGSPLPAAQPEIAALPPHEAGQNPEQTAAAGPADQAGGTTDGGNSADAAAEPPPSRTGAESAERDDAAGPAVDAASAADGDDGADPSPELPRFDAVRVGPQGDLFIAGRSAPGAEVAVLANGEEVARETADAHGDWVLAGGESLPPGPHQLTLMAHADGESTDSDDMVVLVVPGEADGLAGAERRALALLTRRDDLAASEILQAPESSDPAAIPERAPAGARPAADAAPTDAPGPADTADGGPQPQPQLALGNVTADTVPSDTVPSDIVPSDTVPSDTVASDTVPSDAVPSDTVPSDAVPSDAVPSDTVPSDNAPSEVAPPHPAPPETASGSAAPSQGEARDGSAGGPSGLIAGPVAEDRPGVGEAGRVSVGVIDYDDQGRVIVSGQADSPFARMRVYLDELPVGAAVADAAGGFSILLDEAVAPGRYRLRVDSLAEGGAVTARAELAFARADIAIDPDGQRVIIQPGNNLWTIARHVYGSGLRYTAIYRANRAQIRDPHLIYPGQVFSLPEAGATSRDG